MIRLKPGSEIPAFAGMTGVMLGDAFELPRDPGFRGNDRKFAPYTYTSVAGDGTPGAGTNEEAIPSFFPTYHILSTTSLYQISQRKPEQLHRRKKEKPALCEFA